MENCLTTDTLNTELILISTVVL